MHPVWSQGWAGGSQLRKTNQMAQQPRGYLLVAPPCALVRCYDGAGPRHLRGQRLPEEPVWREALLAREMLAYGMSSGDGTNVAWTAVCTVRGDCQLGRSELS